MSRVRDAILLAQSMLSSVDPGIRQDGLWGRATSRAFDSAPREVQAAIDDATRRHFGLTVQELRSSASGGPVRVNTRVQPAAVKRSGGSNESKRVESKSYAAGYSGWRRTIASALEAVGVSEQTTKSVLGQVMTESSGRLTATENHRYSLAFIRKNLSNLRKFTDEQIKDLQSSAERFFNEAYAGKNGNGNVASGDGYKYRGRGPMQLTGKSNYAAVGQYVGHDLVSDPDWVTRSEDNAAASAVGFLAVNRKLKGNLSRAQIAALTNPGLRSV